MEKGRPHFNWELRKDALSKDSLLHVVVASNKCNTSTVVRLHNHIMTNWHISNINAWDTSCLNRSAIGYFMPFGIILKT